MGERSDGGVSALAVRRRRIRPVDDEPQGSWVPDDMLLETGGGVASSIEPDRSWCLPGAGEQDASRRSDPVWRLLDRWSRGGSATVRAGSADVYRVVRLPAETVRASIEQWPEVRLASGRSSLTVLPVGPATLRGELAPAGARRATVEIRFEPWSQRQLCAHLSPVGRSSGRVGSVAWWSAAHELLDELVGRLAHFSATARSQ